jgi:hypothetical protein
MASTSPDPRTDADFDTIKYERDREHELKLNEFTHNLELEQLRLLILLNGGATTAVLAFAEKSASPQTLQALLAAVIVWLVGLGAGAWATLAMREAQSLFAKSYRHRRNAREIRRAPHSGTGTIPPSAYELGLLIESGQLKRQKGFLAIFRRVKSKQPTAVLHDDMAKAARHCAFARSGTVYRLSVASLILFVAGAIAASAGLLGAPAAPAESPREAASSVVFH